MKTRIAILAACVSVLISTAAGAIQTVPIAVTALTGADLTVKRNDGSVVAKMQTDDHGQITLKGLAPGDYVIEINGPSLIKAMDRLAPPAKPSGGGSSFSLGVGGMLGGSHHDADHGAGPYHDSHGSSGGGMGVGVSIPIGGSDGTQPSEYWVVSSALDYEAFKVTYETPYCRDSADPGMRLGFTVPDGAGPVRMTIFATNLFDKHNPQGVY